MAIGHQEKTIGDRGRCLAHRVSMQCLKSEGHQFKSLGHQWALEQGPYSNMIR